MIPSDLGFERDANPLERLRAGIFNFSVRYVLSGEDPWVFQRRLVLWSRVLGQCRQHHLKFVYFNRSLYFLVLLKKFLKRDMICVARHRVLQTIKKFFKKSF
jgi:hypothetical protein